MRRQQLERYRPVELGVLGLVDDAHAAPAELARHAVMRYGRSWCHGVLVSFLHQCGGMVLKIEDDPYARFRILHHTGLRHDDSTVGQKVEVNMRL